MKSNREQKTLKQGTTLVFLSSPRVYICAAFYVVLAGGLTPALFLRGPRLLVLLVEQQYCCMLYENFCACCGLRTVIVGATSSVGRCDRHLDLRLLLLGAVLVGFSSNISTGI